MATCPECGFTPPTHTHAEGCSRSRPDSEIYRDGFRDGIASTRRATQLIIDALAGTDIDALNGPLRGLVDALDWALQSANTDQCIAHWKAIQGHNS